MYTQILKVLSATVFFFGFVNGSSILWNDHSQVNNLEAYKPSLAKGKTLHGKWKTTGYNGPTAIPEVRPDGTIAETPEVAAARAVHLAALETARATNPDTDEGQYDPVKYGEDHYEEELNDQNTFGQIHSNNQGNENNEENVYEKPQKASHTKHFQSLWSDLKSPTYKNEEAKGAQSPIHGVSGSSVPFTGTFEDYHYTVPTKYSPYSGPLAVVKVLPSGFLADTEEVVAARETHLKLLAEAKKAAKLWRMKQAKKIS